MNNVHIREALAVGWNKFIARGWYLFGLTLGVSVLFVVSGSGNSLFTALAYIIYGGYLAIMLRHYRGEVVSFDNMFDLDSRWISFAFLGILKGLLVMIGLVLFILPGIYLAIRWMFAELLVIDEGMRPMEALKKSAEMTYGHRWKLFGFSAVASLVMLLGLVVFVVGGVVAGIVLTFAVIKIYSDLKTLKPETQSIAS